MALTTKQLRIPKLMIRPQAKNASMFRTDVESSKAKTNTNALKRVADTFKGAHKLSMVEEKGKALIGVLPMQALEIFDGLRDEIKAVTKQVKDSAKMQAGLSEGLHKLELRVTDMVADVTESIGDDVMAIAVPVSEKLIGYDHRLTDDTKARVLNRLRAAKLSELPGAFEEYIQAHSVWESMKAGGIPAVGAGVLTYLSNTRNPADSPDLRLALLLGVGLAALYGKAASTWIGSALVPSVEFVGEFLGLSHTVNPTVTNVRLESVEPLVETRQLKLNIAYDATLKPRLWTANDTKINLSSTIVTTPMGALELKHTSTTNDYYASNPSAHINRGYFIIDMPEASMNVEARLHTWFEGTEPDRREQSLAISDWFTLVVAPPVIPV